MRKNTSKLWLIIVLVLFSTFPLFSHTWVEVGLDSNLLVHNGQVIFAQSDKTMTVLDVETGKVIKRQKNLYCEGDISATEFGIFCSARGSIGLVDEKTHEIIWEIEDAYRGVLAGDVFVCLRGEDQIQCRDLKTCELKWSFTFPLFWYIYIVDDKVLLEGSNDNVEIILDLKTGEKLNLKMSLPKPKLSKYGCFGPGKRLDDSPSITERRISWGNQLILGDASIAVNIRYMWSENLPHKEGNTFLEYQDGTSKLWGYFPQSDEWNPRVTGVEITDKYIIVGTDEGTVECIDKKSGESKWVYFFPKWYEMMSWSSAYVKPFYAEKIEEHRLMNEGRTVDAGFTLVGNDPVKPNVILDPEPGGPFHNYYSLLGKAWGVSVISVIILLTSLIWFRKKQKGIRGVAVIGIITAGAAAYCLWNYGKVSRLSSFGIRFGLALNMTMGLMFMIKAYRKKYWATATASLLGFAGVIYYVFPVLFRIY